MKILVAIKQVPQRDSVVRIDASDNWISEENVTFETNEADAYALEESLRLKEQHGGEVIVVSVGPERVRQSMRDALAKGADRAVHINWPNLTPLDALATARMLASIAADEKPDLILTGLQSDDLGLGQTGVVLAELLDIPHTTIVMQVELRNGTVRVKRELESGWFQWVDMNLPALLTIQSGINRLRYATLMGIRKAQSKEIKQVICDLSAAPGRIRAGLQRVYPALKKKNVQIIEGTPHEAAAVLVEKLRSEVRVV